MDFKRVVVTGLGAVTPIGTGVDKYWSGLLEGKSGVAPITRFDTTNHSVKIAAEVKDHNPEDHFERKEIKKLDYFTQFAVVAAREAFKNSGLDPQVHDSFNIGTLIGVGMGWPPPFREPKAPDSSISSRDSRSAPTIPRRIPRR